MNTTIGMALAAVVFGLLGPAQGQATDAARARALTELKARVSEPERIEHALAVEAIMVALARRAGGDRQEWALAGLLHDIDLAETRADPSQHGVVGARLLAGLGYSDAIVHAVQAHDDVAGVPRTSPIAHALYCADRGYWAARASGLRFPSPQATAATPASIVSALEGKGATDRIDARLTAECGRLGLTLEALLGVCLGVLRSPPALEPSVLGATAPGAAAADRGAIWYGAAYYVEYAPSDRLDADVALMKSAGITVVRIGESTWSTLEPQDGVFDYSHIDRVIKAMDKAGIRVIVGTPTYAIPTWLARKYPDVLAVTPAGRSLYGPRQNMDITNAHFRFHAERVIRNLVSHVKDQAAVVGYQIDNETKSYRVSGPEVQRGFVASLKSRFPNLEALNRAYGLDYWSSRINNWEDFPSIDGAVNASLTCAFAEYQRGLVTDYLGWQAAIVRELKRSDQFITHNFDMDWRGYSYGIQPEVDHFAAARALDIAGIDIYHPTQDHLTGAEIAFGGDLARSMRGGSNYLVIETQAQGFPEWTPYPGQLRLQAYSHLAGGAEMVSYWHWATTNNSVETYWRGLLSQDYAPNPTFQEATRLGAELKRIGPELAGLQKRNQVAVYFSNRALTAFNAFKFGWTSTITYNDVLRPFFDALYRANVEADLVDGSTRDLSRYKLIVVPALYSASDAEIAALTAYARAGGNLVLSFKSGFTDEHVKVRSTSQPGGFAEAAGVTYSQFVIPEKVSLRAAGFESTAADVRWWMELLQPTTATVVARYDHPVWNSYAAITRNRYGKGEVTYIGFMPGDALIGRLLADAADRAQVARVPGGLQFPTIVRSGVNSRGRAIHYLLNYSAEPRTVVNPFAAGTELLSDKPVRQGERVELGPWGVAILAENP
jgi:beta-galactosidase